MLQYASHSGQRSRANVVSFTLNELSHLMLNLVQTRPPPFVGHTRTRERIAKYSHIRIPMRHDAVKVYRPSGNVGQDLAEGEVVNGVRAVEERAVDIEQIRVIT